MADRPKTLAREPADGDEPRRDASVPAIAPHSPARLFFEKRYMIFVAVAGNAIFYIQAGKIFFVTREAGDLSWLAFTVSVWGLASWLAYGVVLKNPVLIVANIVGVIGALLVLLGIAMYS